MTDEDDGHSGRETGAVGQTIAELRELEDLPEAGDDLVFDAPWQARAFAVVVTLYRQGLFEWNEFQARLIEEIQAADADPDRAVDTENDYYRHWIAAAEALLSEKGVVAPDELTDRAGEFATGERDASEFVVGVEKAHSHSHDHDH